MNSVKATLHDTIELLSEKEARQIMKFAQILRNKKGASLTLKRLSIDPAFKMPAEKTKAFRSVEPIHGKGIPASRLLIEDRR